jgi:hypothetical protein
MNNFIEHLNHEHEFELVRKPTRFSAVAAQHVCLSCKTCDCILHLPDDFDGTLEEGIELAASLRSLSTLL